MKKTIITSLLFCLTVAFTASRATAQGSSATQSNGINIALTYDTQHGNFVPADNFWAQGAGMQADISLLGGLGLAADVTGVHKSQASTSGTSFGLLTYMAGPSYRYSPSHAKKLSFFAHDLLGVAHGFDSIFPNPNGQLTSSSAFANKAGGGLDVMLKHSIGIRIVQADFLYTRLPNATNNQQDNFEVGAGVVFHIK